MNSAIESMTARLQDAIASGERLHIGVTLSYVGGGSDKFWSAVWADREIAVNFGRHDHAGQFQLHHEFSDDHTARKMWDLLRSKTAKGYTVVDAATIHLPIPAPAPTTTVAARTHASQIMSMWDAYRDARALNPRRPLDHPELLGRSPRLKSEGARVLLDITAANAPQETLLAAAVSDPTERFLPPIVMSRPDVPAEAKFLAALAGTTKVAF